MKRNTLLTILIYVILAVTALYAAMGLTTTSNLIEYENGVPVNQSASIGSVSVTNTGDIQLNVRFDALVPDPSDVPQGILALPDPGWVTFSKNNFPLNPGEKTSVNVSLKALYGGGSYKGYIWCHTVNGGATQIGTIVPLTFSVRQSSVKIAGNNFFFPPAKLGMTGNKLVVKLQIYSDSPISSNFYYRKIGAAPYSSIPMTVKSESDSVYLSRVEIPAYLVKPPGLEYYIEIKSGNSLSYIPDTAPAEPFRIDVDNRTKGKMSKKGGKLSAEDANPDDGETCLEFPPSSLSGDYDIAMNQLDNDMLPGAFTGPVLSSAPLMAFEFSPHGIQFRRPVKLSMLYFDLDNDGLVDGTQFDERTLRLFWWDGYEWRMVGGVVDPDKNTVNVNISHFSYYAIFPAGALTADSFRPKENIITPAYKDGVNDVAVFDNLAGSDFEISLFDITGRLVRKINDESLCGPQWDGTDEFGRVVESGVYIYQFKADINGEKKLVSGTLVVAK